MSTSAHPLPPSCLPDTPPSRIHAPDAAASPAKHLAWGRALSAAQGVRLGRVLVLLLALGLVGLQPAGEPWWYTADSDGVYLSNALNLLSGRPTKMLDHPALPLQALLTLSLEADRWLRCGGESVGAYVAAGFADPDRLTGITAGWGMILLLAAVMVAYEIGRRRQRDWRWGVVAAALFLAIPGHLAFATMFRPENLLSGLCLLSGYLLVRGMESRRPTYLLAAALLIGHAVTQKVHAIGMLPALLVAVWALRGEDWTARTVTGWHRLWQHHRRGLLVAAGLWCGVQVLLNLRRPPAMVGWKVFALAGMVGAYLVVAERFFRRPALRRWIGWGIHPACAWVFLACVAGAVLPSMWLLDEVRPLFWQLTALLSGGGVNTGMSAGGVWTGLSALWGRLDASHMLPLVFVGSLGAWRVLRRGWGPQVIWLVAAGGMLLPALARSSVSPSAHYLAPTLVLLIPLVLDVLAWFRRPVLEAGAANHNGLCPAPAAWLVVGLLVAAPYVGSVRQAWANVARAERIESVSRRVLADLPPGGAVLMNYGAMDAQANYYRQMVDYCVSAPMPPLRCFPDVPHGLAECRRQGLRPAYYMMAPGSGRPRVSEAGGQTIATNAWGERFVVSWVATYPAPPLRLEVYRVLRHLPAEG